MRHLQAKSWMIEKDMSVTKIGIARFIVQQLILFYLDLTELGRQHCQAVYHYDQISIPMVAVPSIGHMWYTFNRIINLL